jgi:hypothetical protein
MLLFRKFWKTILYVALLGLFTQAAAQETVSIRLVEPENDRNLRRLFSLVNYPYLLRYGNSASIELFNDLNPRGTQARTEIMMQDAEPVNDNDDPNDTDLDRYNLENRYRFITDPANNYLDILKQRGITPLYLLTYCAPWLGREGRANDPPEDNSEWAEFATAMITAAGGSDRVPYVELWNEPLPNSLYWQGSMEDYFIFFNTVSSRIRSNFPRVKIGGPSVFLSDGVYLKQFLVNCGENADFLTVHIYNDDPFFQVRKLAAWGTYSGKKLMVTEADNWQLSGWEKQEYLFIRQWELIENEKHLEGFHQFCLPYYSPSPDQTFGLLRMDGSIIDENYWPYWFFRDLEGSAVIPEIEGDHRLVRDWGIPIDRRRGPRPFYALLCRRPSGSVRGEGYSLYIFISEMEEKGLEIKIAVDEVPVGAGIMEIERVTPSFHGVWKRLEPRQNMGSLSITIPEAGAYSFHFSGQQ